MKSNTSQVVVAGHICLDIIPDFSTGEKLPEPGQLIQVGQAHVSTGGPVSNTGLALNQLGIETQLMGKIGDDAFGDILLGLVESYNPTLAEGIILVEDETTSYSVILSLPEVDRSFLHCPGANDTFSYSDLKLETIAETRLFHFGYPPLMANMYANKGRELEKTYRTVKSLGITTSLDMVMVEPHSEAGQADWETILKRTLPNVDLFMPSIEELLLLLHYPPEKTQWVEQGAQGTKLNTPFLRELAEKLLKWGAGLVVLKLGTCGIYMRTAGKSRLEKLGAGAPTDLAAWSNREIWSPIFQVDRFGGTTGAGDAAIAGFISAVLREKPPEESLMYACAVGACCVEEADALSGLQTWENTVTRVSNGWQRLPLTFNEPNWALHPGSKSWLGPFDYQYKIR